MKYLVKGGEIKQVKEREEGSSSEQIFDKITTASSYHSEGDIL